MYLWYACIASISAGSSLGCLYLYITRSRLSTMSISEKVNTLRTRIHAHGNSRAHMKQQALMLLPEMLDALGLALSAGLSFERAVILYAQRFDNEFARHWLKAVCEWGSGLKTKEESLTALAQLYDVPVMTSFIEGVMRSTRFGTPLSHLIEVSAQEARSIYLADIEVRVAHTPSKVLVATTVLILPAVLLLIMGPIFLEFR